VFAPATARAVGGTRTGNVGLAVARSEGSCARRRALQQVAPGQINALSSSTMKLGENGLPKTTVRIYRSTPSSTCGPCLWRGAFRPQFEEDR
jgi:hypothetical protein